MIDIFVLNNCVKASWINRWALNYDNADIVGRRAISNIDKPVDQWGVSENLLNSDKIQCLIMQQWKLFKQCFYRVNDNFGKACLFENDGLLVGRPIYSLEAFLNVGNSFLFLLMKQKPFNPYVVFGFM